MATVLEISDGTTTVALNLAEGVSGFKLSGLESAWQPSNPFYKAGGVWQSSPLADGRQLVDKRFENVIDTFSVHVEGTDQDDVIEKLQDLKRLLEKAANYWATDWQNTPVYIKAKATDETNARYGLIYTGRIVQDGNPYACRFNGGVGSDNDTWMWDLQLIIEHSLWTENAPGTGTAVEISALETWDGRNLGNVDDAGARDPTTAFEVYWANKDNEANLTHIFINDGGVWSANLMDAALPYSLLPAVPAVNDAIYFGIEQVLPLVPYFCSLVFDIGTAGAGYTGVWEYSINLGVFNAIPNVQDNTNAAGAMTGIAFDTTGVNSVHWVQSDCATWQGWTLNGVAAIWVRYRITGVPGALTAPTQQNRDVYSVVWSYTEIQSTDVLGDVQALAKIEIYDQADKDGPNGSAPDLYEDRFVLGLRSMSRGENFRARLNIADLRDAQNPTGVTVTLGANTAGTVLNVEDYIVGEEVRYVTAGVSALSDEIIFTFNSSLMQEYFGKFHVFFVGALQTDMTARLKSVIGSGGVETYSELITITDNIVAGAFRRIVDFGTIEIPGGKLKSSETGDQTQLVVQLSAAGAVSVRVEELILIPVDEWAVDAYASNEDDDAVVENDTYLMIDSLTYPKVDIRSIVFTDSDEAKAYYSTVANGRAKLQANAKQRLWCVAMKGIYDTGELIYYNAEFESTYKILIERNQQYLSMRGSR